MKSSFAACSTLEEAVVTARRSGRPLVWGHRGAMALAPQNTIISFQAALDAGADGIELDVQLTADGHLAVIHDSTVDATTNGQGRVDSLTWKDLAALDAGQWMAPGFAGTRIPLLEEVFEKLGPRLFINVELKYDFPPMGRWDYLVHGFLAPEPVPQDETAVHREASRPLVEAVAALVETSGMGNRVLISSFNPLALELMSHRLPTLPLALLTARSVRYDTRRLVRYVAQRAWHPHQVGLTATQIRRTQELGLWVNTWTVNSLPRARQLGLWGVDGLIGNNPGELRNLFF